MFSSVFKTNADATFNVLNTPKLLRLQIEYLRAERSVSFDLLYDNEYKHDTDLYCLC